MDADFVYILLGNVDNDVVLRVARAQDVVRRVPGLFRDEVKKVKSEDEVLRAARAAAPQLRAGVCGRSIEVIYRANHQLFGTFGMIVAPQGIPRSR